MPIGISLMVIAVIHALFGLAVFPGVWMKIAREGFFDSVGVDPMRGAVVWFELYAVPVFAYGHLIATMERRGVPLPSHLRWYLLGTLISGVVLMPVSGFWLLLIPMYFLWRRRGIQETSTDESAARESAPQAKEN